MLRLYGPSYKTNYIKSTSGTTSFCLETHRQLKLDICTGIKNDTVVIASILTAEIMQCFTHAYHGFSEIVRHTKSVK